MRIQITDLDMPELAIYKAVNENRLRRYYEPAPGLFICESAKVIRRALDAGYEPVSVLSSVTEPDEDAGYVLERCPDIPFYYAKEDVLKNLAGFSLTDGMLCAMRRRKLPEASGIIMNKTRIAVLEDVENPTNVGAIFRSAAALGMEAVILTHGSADPLYRRAARVSMGSVFLIPWTFCDSAEDVITVLKGSGFTTIAMALSDDSVSVGDPLIRSAHKKSVFLGNEGYGLTADTISNCDIVAKIPMNPDIDSLNVAAAGAVIFWELSKTE